MSNILLRTPKPYSLESFAGYLLRLTELNGLASFTPILKLAGISREKTRHAEQPVEVLQSVTGHDINILAHLPLTHPVTKIQQMSGHPLSKGYSIITAPKICPRCIEEFGYAPAAWDLLAVQGCHKHQQTLITVCQECKSKLSWRRPGLLTCNCGADLAKSQGDTLTQEEMEFLRVLEAQFQGHTLEDSESMTGLPFKHLTQISLSTFLAILHTMGAMQLFLDDKVPRAKACTHIDEVRSALEVLKDWPNNFFKFLHCVGERHGQVSLGLDRQFSFFTQRFFKRGYPEKDIQFLKEAFILFGKEHWGKAFYYPRMQVNSLIVERSNFVGVNEFAGITGHTASTIRKMIKDGRIMANQLDGSKVDKYIIDIAKSNIQLPAIGNTIGAREAGKFIGLPVSVIKNLRKIGAYKSSHLTVNKESFCIEDLILLKQKILDCQKSKIPTPALISLSFIMRKSFRNSTMKTMVIQKIMESTLDCFGSTNEIQNIHIKVSDLESLANDVLSDERDWLTLKQVSTILSCDIGIISKMLQDGHIHGLLKNGVHQLNKQSVISFKQRYITLQQLSFSFKLGVKALNCLCHENGLAVVSVKRKFNVCQNFIAKSSVSTLAKYVEDYYFNHKKLAYRSRLESIDFGRLLDVNH